MSEENFGNFFRPEDFDDEIDRDQETWKPERQFGKELFRKSIDILNLVETIASMLQAPEGEPEKRSCARMTSSAMIIPPKIKGALCVDAYSVKMECAVLIKTHMCDLRSEIRIAEQFENLDKDYVDVMRNEIDSFRKIFVQWVDSFDRDEDYPDEWHLFNNPDDFPKNNDPLDSSDFPEDDVE
jgi:hypothetical protein